MEVQLKRCVFCDKELTGKQKSIEHIIPQWLLEELDVKKEVIKPTHLTPDFNIISQRVHVADKFVSGHFCFECNNG